MRTPMIAMPSQVADQDEQTATLVLSAPGMVFDIHKVISNFTQSDVAEWQLLMRSRLNCFCLLSSYELEAAGVEWWQQSKIDLLSQLDCALTIPPGHTLLLHLEFAEDSKEQALPHVVSFAHSDVVHELLHSSGPRRSTAESDNVVPFPGGNF